MRHVRLHRRGWLAVSAGSLAVAVTVPMAILSAGASASTLSHVHARPHGLTARDKITPATLYPVQKFTQEFAYNTNFFCPAGSGNAPCDGNGAAGDYGTIDRVSSGFTNGGYGNYAPSTPALTGSWMAVTSGTGVGNQGAGCPGVTATSNPGETCTGPYALFGTGAAAGAENVFPSKGFTVTSDLYLSPTTTTVAGSLVDNDVEINNSAGTYGIDNIATACAEPTSPGGLMGYVINFGHNSPGSCAGTPQVTSDGWYRFVFVFSNVAGKAYLTESVYSEPGLSQVATSEAQPVGGGSPQSIHNWGGPGYFWLPSEDMSGLPLANFALQLGQHATGKTP